MRFVVTGGAGFIGSALVRYLARELGHEVLNIDKLTYAASDEALRAVADLPNYGFRKIDILDAAAVESALMNFRPDGLFHLAAETHVDRSIATPDVFVETNVLGTQRLLTATSNYLKSGAAPEGFRLIHISTDEVFGELSADGSDLFTEDTRYDPRSPYAASKAASDHFVRAWVNTYHFPAIITNCSNNYGPFQHQEKLVPLIIKRGLLHQTMPVYGEGLQIRDWLHVDDHVRGLFRAFEVGKIGRSYNIGGNNERRNIEVVTTICESLDRHVPWFDDTGKQRSHSELIAHVTDRAGHDFRYAIDPTRARNELGWEPLESFDTGLEKTVMWYIGRSFGGGLPSNGGRGL